MPCHCTLHKRTGKPTLLVGPCMGFRGLSPEPNNNNLLFGQHTLVVRPCIRYRSML